MPFPRYLYFTVALICMMCLFDSEVRGGGFRVHTFAGDTIVKMKGYVYDSISEKPDTVGIKAKIILESQPHGSEVGIITSNDSSGYFEYYVNLGHQYRIEIQSDGHRIYIENFNPRYFIRNMEITRIYYLVPEVKENQVIRLDDLIFDQGQSNITSDSYGELNRLLYLMEEKPKMQIQLEGHTDYRGSKKLNLELSQNRVDAVKAYLIGKGIAPKRIKTKAFGGSKPLVKERSIEASELNRRVEVRILKIE
jgi:OmpA-OmpF porin, OOP family